jgi:dipeptide/tripeptide permease
MAFRDELRALSAAPRELWLVYAVKLFESVAYFTVYTLLAIYLSEDLGYSDTEAGSVTGTWLTAVSLMVFGAGFIADAMGVRRAMLLAVLSTCVGRGLLALSGSETGVMLGLAASVWGIGCLKPTMNAAVRAYTSAATVSIGFSLYYVTMNLGAVMQGPLISQFRSLFAEGATLGGRAFSSSELVFLVGFGVSCVNLVLVLAMREPPAESRGASAGPLAIAREVMKERTFWVFMGFVALLTFVRLVFQHAHLTWPKYSLRAFGALSVFAMAFSTTVAASVVFIVTLSIGEALWSPRLYEYTATIAPRGREASYMGLSEVPLFLAKPIVGWMSGYLLQAYCPATGCDRPQQMWLVVGAMTIAAPLIMLVGRRRLEATAA